MTERNIKRDIIPVRRFDESLAVTLTDAEVLNNTRERKLERTLRSDYRPEASQRLDGTAGFKPKQTRGKKDPWLEAHLIQHNPSGDGEV